MQVFPVKTPLLKQGDYLAEIIQRSIELQENDILIISSKAVTATESGYTKLSPPNEKGFKKAVEQEMKRMRGSVASVSPHAILTYLKPDGFGEGTLLAVNAGLDQSNTPEGHAIGWPKDPVASVQRLRNALEARMKKPKKPTKRLSSDSSVSSDSSSFAQPSPRLLPASKATEDRSVSSRLAVIISDSCCMPARLGVTAFALAVSGIDPFANRIGEADLFGKKLRMTQEAIADQLATIANFVMGNSDESVPAAVIRDHGLAITKFCGWVPGIEPGEDLFGGLWK